jgi:stage III sporulation protein AA
MNREETMDRNQEIINIFPVVIREDIKNCSFFGLEEIRIRLGLPVELIYDNRIIWLRNGAYSIDRLALEEMLNYMTGYSYYAMAEELKRGFLTLSGGHRIGITGKCNFHSLDYRDQVDVTGMVDIGGLNIRIAHEKKGCAKDIIPFIRKEDGIYNTLFFSAPGIGKTTYLRDTIRLLSLGDHIYPGIKICVVDERSEIGACREGKPQNDLGCRTDVLDGCPKEIGMDMVLRSMSPQVIAVDELGKKTEVLMLQKMGRCGVKVLGTMHGGSMEELSKIYGYQMLSCFERFIELIRLSDGRRKFVIHDRTEGVFCSDIIRE